jgi:hypothetical protein
MKASSLLFMSFLLLAGMQKPVAQTQKQGLVHLNTFHKSPVDGCADYFFLSQNDLKKDQFVCIRDFAQIAFIKINGKLEKMIYQAGKSTEDATYASAEYLVNIKMLSKKNTGSESYRTRAILTVYHKGKAVLIKNVIGYGGC